LIRALQELALAGVLAAGNRGFVFSRRFSVSVQPPQQVGANRVEQMVITEVEGVDDGKRGTRSLNFCDRHRAIERDDRTGCHR
jgi:hypothetical protein